MTSRVMILALCGMATVAHAEEPCASLSTMHCAKESRCTIDTETHKCKDRDICGAGCAAFTAAQCGGSMGRGCGCALHHTGACMTLDGTEAGSPPASPPATWSGAECAKLSRTECRKDGKAKGCYLGTDMLLCSACSSKRCAAMSLMECGLAASCGCGVTAAQTCAGGDVAGGSSGGSSDGWDDSAVIAVAVVVPVVVVAAVVGVIVSFRSTQSEAEVESPQNAALREDSDEVQGAA